MKFSFNNINVNSPWWWKRFESAAIFLLTGSIPLVQVVAGMEEILKQNLSTVVFPLMILIVKTMGILMGDSNASPASTEEKQELRSVERKLQEKWEEERADKGSRPE